MKLDVMKLRSGFVLIFLFLLQMSYSQTFGGGKNDVGASFCELTNGELFLLGTTRSAGAGSDDVWLMKLDHKLNFVKDVFFGWNTNDVASKVVKTYDNNVVITGDSWSAPGPGWRGDVFLNKYTGNGDFLWSAYFGGASNDYASSVVETLDHGYAITGVDEGGASKGDAYLYKVDEYGVKQWGKTFQTTTKDMGMDVIQCPDSSYFVLLNTETFHGKIANASEYRGSERSNIKLIKTDKYGEETWSKFYGGDDYDFAKSIVRYGADYYFIGSSKNGPLGSFDISIHKIDEDGNVQWVKYYGGSDYDYGSSLDVNSNGELLVTGSSSSNNPSSNSDIYIAKLNENGDVLWEQYIDNGWSDYGEQGKFIRNDQIAVVGTTTLSDLTTDMYFKKLDTFGNEIVSEQYLGTEEVFSVVPNPSGGRFYIDFGSYSDDEVRFELFDGKGQRLLSSNVKRDQIISVGDNLSAGFYVYKIHASSGLLTGKVIIN